MKKCFCDGWDNLLSLVIYNVFFIVLIVGFYYLGVLFVEMPVLLAAAGIVFLLLFSTMLLAVNQTAAKYADFKSVPLRDTFLAVPGVIKDACLLVVLFSLLIFLARIGIPFYMRMNTLFGLFLASVVFWFILITFMALQWYFPIRAQLGNTFFKAVKKSYLLFFDNAAFSVGMFLYSVVIAVLSVFTLLMIPGFSGLLLAWNNALRLRLYKYDWMEAHPEIPMKDARRQIPWDELIAEDRETVGPRSLRSFIFPWKD